MKKFQNFKCKIYPYYEKTEECLICLEKLIDNKIYITRCGHCYHKSCLQKYYKYSNDCPLCRKILK